MSTPSEWHDLANAIIIQAAEDYLFAYYGGYYGGYSSEEILSECDSFFNSHWYRILTNVDAEWLKANLIIRDCEKHLELYERCIRKAQRDDPAVKNIKVPILVNGAYVTTTHKVSAENKDDFIKYVNEQILVVQEELARAKAQVRS